MYAASTADGRVGLAVATVKSGKVAVVPMDGENLTSPCWSEDGEWIYYWSGSGFGRVRANGSEREEVMRYERTEYRLRPVYQGGYLYFASKGAPYALGRLHVATRREEVLVESAQTSDFAVTARSLYFVKTARAGRELYRVALGGAPGTASAELVATIPVTEQVPLPLGGFAVSRDESKVVYSMPSGQSLQLQYIPNFR
ncbi:hypothetical protein F183_A03520 [Bryobacterales bacterium F-183]|nr:hypothetical protein F183_A03520 [Bryobacterales bacterium F-183]